MSTELKTFLASRLNEVVPSQFKRLVVQCGHFPLSYSASEAALVEDLGSWCGFTDFTWKLGVEVALLLRERGARINIAIICDDRDASETLFQEHSARQLPQWKAMRRRFFKDRQHISQLHSSFRDLLSTYQLSEVLLRHDQEKEGRHSSVYFSETLLREQKDPVLTNEIRACTLAYENWLSKFIHPENDCLLSFVPRKCLHSVQDAFLFGEFTGPHLHVFLPTDKSSAQLSHSKLTAQVDLSTQGNIDNGSVIVINENLRVRNDVREFIFTLESSVTTEHQEASQI